jgi:hypothetical protein
MEELLSQLESSINYDFETKMIFQDDQLDDYSLKDELEIKEVVEIKNSRIKVKASLSNHKDDGEESVYLGESSFIFSIKEPLLNKVTLEYSFDLNSIEVHERKNWNEE